jgi:hypothetical protein
MAGKAEELNRINITVIEQLQRLNSIGTNNKKIVII